MAPDSGVPGLSRAPAATHGSYRPPGTFPMVGSLGHRFDWDTWSREGLLVGGGLGTFGCTTLLCDGAVVGFTGHMEIGYRFGWVAPVAGFGAGIGVGLPASADLPSRMRVADVSAGLLLFPVGGGRFDPYVGARLGYAHTLARLTVPGAAEYEVFSRVGARLTAGLGIYINPSVSIGPRFDMVLPFAGQVCAADPFVDCVSVSEIPGSYRGDLPRWWSVTVGVHVTLPQITLRR